MFTKRCPAGLDLAGRAAAAAALVIAAAALGAGCEAEEEEVSEEEEEITRAEPGVYDAEPDVTDDYEVNEAVEVAEAGWRVEQITEGDEPGGVRATMPGASGSGALELTREQPANVRAGETLTYTIAVSNVSELPVYGVVVEEWRTGSFEVEDVQVPGGSQAMQRRQQQQATGSRAADRWMVGSLRPGETKRISVRGIATGEGQIQTCMSATYNQAVCYTTEVVRPELMLTKQIVGEQVNYVCDDVEVIYLVENVGSGVATNLTLSEELPEGLALAEGGATVNIPIERLGPGETLERRVVLQARSPGEYTTYATVASGDLRARSRETALRFALPRLELAIDAPAREYVGRDVQVRVTIRNTGKLPAVDTVLRLGDAAGLAQMSLSTQTATLAGDAVEIGRIEAGEERTLTMTFLADEPRTESIELQANAYCARAVSQRIDVELVGVEAVRLETIDLVDPVVVGEETVYEVRVKNQGTAEAINVKVTATLPDAMSFVGGSGDSEVRGRGQDVDLAPIDRLPPGALATWRIRAMAEEPGKAQLKLQLTSDATRQPAEEEEPTTIISSVGSRN